MTEHRCNANPADGLVCSHALTPALLEELGFTVEKTDVIMGTKVVVEKGTPFVDARHEAWVAGKTRLCTRRSS